MSSISSCTLFFLLSHFVFAGETSNFEDAFANSDVTAGSIALSFYSGFWAYSGWLAYYLIPELFKFLKNFLTFSVKKNE